MAKKQVPIISFWLWAEWEYGITDSDEITYGMMKEFAELKLNRWSRKILIEKCSIVIA